MPRYNSKFFDAAYYINANKDVAANWVGDVQEHFFNYGAKEGRLPSSWFDFQYIRSTYSDLAGMTNEQLFSHYNNFGSNEGRVTAAAYANFDAAKYLSTYADLGTAGITAAKALSHFLAFGQGEGRTALNKDGSTIASGGSGVGSTFTLTTNVDNLTGTSGNDNFIGDSASTSAADTLTGGNGNADTFTLMMDGANESVVATGVEVFKLQASGAGRTFTASNVTGATEFNSNQSTDNLTITGVNANAILSSTKSVSTGGVNATDATVGGAGGFIATFANNALASTTATLSLSTNGTGTAAAAYEFDVNSAGTDKFSTVEITNNTGKSVIALDGGALALTKVVAKGDSLVTVADATVTALANVATVDSSASTGGLNIDLASSTNAKDVAVTGGAGDDTVKFAATQFTTLDVVDLAGGTGDTIVTGDAVFTASTDAVVKALNAAKNVEVAGSSVTAATGIQVKMSVLTGINSFTFGGITPAAAGANTDGVVAATLTGVEAADTFIITGNVVGGAPTSGDASGADAINVTPLVDSGTDTLNLVFKAGAAIAVTGGNSFDAGANGGKVSGDALDAASIEKITIKTDSAADDVTFAAGTAAGADTAGSSVKVGANAVITITGAGDVNLGTLVAPSTAADDLTVDGSGMTGVLTVTTGVGNDVVKGGTKADNITVGTGTDTITLGTGADVLNVTKGDAVGSHDTVTDFAAGAGGDILKGLSASYDALTNAEQTAVTAETTLAAAVNTALVGATNSQWTAFTYGSKTYAVYDTDDTFDTTNGFIVELTGVTVANLVASNFAA